MASVNYMRISLRKGAVAALLTAAWQKIRVRSVENIPRNGPQNCRSLGWPGFPVEVGGVAISTRFSLQKTAHAALSSAANRKSGYARDDKGEGDASMESGCWTEGVFHPLGWAAKISRLEAVKKLV